MVDKKKYIDYVTAQESLILDISHKIWDYAELSLKEYKSAALYIEKLKEAGFDVEEKLCGIDTCFSGKFGKGRPYIGILAEFDALDGLSQKGDCEDHAILFASIVKAMGFDVALFKLSMDGMSQHIAAGVNVKGASGTSFEFEGKAYYYCETTSDVGDSYLNSWNVGSMTWGYNLWDIVLVPRSCSSAGARNTGIS